jgi:hypothetical protein
MYFRERGNRVQLVRSQYDPKSKRPRQEIVGSMARLSLDVPADVMARLTAAERQELRAYIDRVKTLNLLRTKLAAYDLPRVVAEAVQYAAQVNDPHELDLLRQHFAEAMAALRRASVKALSGAEMIEPAA